MTTAAFPFLAAALKEYDRTAPSRDELWAGIDRNEDAVACKIFDDAAESLVQMAFYQDTKAYNRMSDCLNLRVQDLRKHLTET